MVIPAGKTTIHVENGFRRTPALIERDFSASLPIELPVRLDDNDLPPDFGKFLSADLHVHMNYGGHYRSTPETLLAQQDAEDLDVVYNLLVNKEERIPDIGYFRPGGGADPASGKRLLFHAQEYHTSFWGHMGLLNLEDHYLLPDYAAYRHTALASPWPNNGAIADLAHAQGALVGYVHIADFPIDPPKEKVLSYELPATVAHGKVDYLEVMGFSDHHITAGIWYRLLNLGFRLPAGAGTDAMANYASLRGPIGLVRVFLETNGERTPKALIAALKSGRTFVSNGPLLGLEVDGQTPGRSPRRAPASGRCASRCARPLPSIASSWCRTGASIKSFKLTGDRTRFDWNGDVDFDGGGWVVLRAFNDQPDPWVLDLYPYATTSPIYFDSPAAPPAPEDAAYFVAWMDRVVEAALARGGWNSEQEKADTLAYLNHAREKFRALAGITDKGLTMRPMLRLRRPPGRRRPRVRRRRGRAHEVHRRRPRSHRERLGPRPLAGRRIRRLQRRRAELRGGRGALRPLARALGRQRQASTHAHAGLPTNTRLRTARTGSWIAFLSDRGDEDAETQVWIMPADGGEAEALTEFPGGVSDFDWSPDSAAARGHRRRSRAAGGRRSAEAARADRHQPLLLQGRLRRLADRQAPAPVPVRDRRQEGDAAHFGRPRRAPAGLVPGRHAHRLRDQARPGSRPPPQLGRLRRRGPRRRRGEAAHHASPARTTTRRSSRVPPGARTASASPTCRPARTSGSTTRPGRSPSSTSRAVRSRGPRASS